MRAYSERFLFYAVVLLPYTQNAVDGAIYALETLGAACIALYSNFEGRYFGDPSLTPFFEAMDARGPNQIIYIHPTTLYLRLNGSLVEANPTTYPTLTYAPSLLGIKASSFVADQEHVGIFNHNARRLFRDRVSLWIAL